MTRDGAGGPAADGVRLQKFLAQAGVASRRKAEELIVAGRVKVNERAVKELGTRIDPARDLVTVDGRLVSRPETKSYYLLYKPSGCVTTASDPEGRPTALEYLRGVKGRLFSVGRLDYDAEGAVVFTDDGELANRLAHPRYGHRRTYLVKVRGEPPASALERMVAGVRLEDGPARALEVAVHERAERNVWIRVVVAEGRFHLVKRLCEAVGLFVQRLFRPEFGGVTVEGLRPGQFRPLAPVELRAMKAAVGLGGGAPATSAPRELPRAARRHGHGPPPPPEPFPPRVPVPARDVERAERPAAAGRGDVRREDRRVADQAERARPERGPRGRAEGERERRPAQARSGAKPQERARPERAPRGRPGGERERRPAQARSGAEPQERERPERAPRGRARGEQERRRPGSPPPRSGAGGRTRERGPRR
ncbi:MAG TPA: pseudouridine synthase [Anaeromyxobacter sp.]|nr:pseudouridine synthase [Anaeromyxobacter sp.]